MAFNEFFIDPDSGSSIRLYPSFDYSESIIRTGGVSRTIGGQLNAFRVAGGYFRVTLPLDFVSSSDASRLTDFWKTGSAFKFSEQAGAFVGDMRARIVNTSKPFPTKPDANFDRYNGVLHLISVDDLYNPASSILEKGVFVEQTLILDDSTFGILDENTLG